MVAVLNAHAKAVALFVYACAYQIEVALLDDFCFRFFKKHRKSFLHAFQAVVAIGMVALCIQHRRNVGRKRKQIALVLASLANEYAIFQIRNAFCTRIIDVI